MTKRKPQIRPQAENANAHTPRGLGLLEGSIQRDGWIGAITTAADGETFDGSARDEIAEAQGFALNHPEPLVIDAPDDRPVYVRSTGKQPLVHIRQDIPSADDERARRLSVAANQIAAVDWAPDAGLLAEWAEMDGAIRGMWDAPAWGKIMEQAGSEIISANDLWRGMPEFEHEDQTADAAFTIRVFLRDADDLAAFGKLLGKDLTGHKFVWFSKQPRGEAYEATE